MPIQLIVFLILVFTTGFSQTNNSLLNFDELVFVNNTEEDVFRGFFIESDSNYISLLSIAGDSISKENLNIVTGKIKKRATQFKTSNFEKMSDSKQIKFIYKKIHAEFLEKYSIKGFLNDIFINGEYNCVSASAFYGLIFNELNIPYVVKESRNHVYLLAYPKSHSIMVESTDPMGGYFVMNDAVKHAYIKYLLNMKIISQSEYDTKSLDELFDEYYLKEKDINLLELAGLLYYNKSLLLIDDENYQMAYYMAEKAYYLYPDNRTTYLLVNIMSTLLSECDYSDTTNASIIYKLARFKDAGISIDIIHDEFVRLTWKVLINSYDTTLYDTYYHEIMDHLEDSALISSIGYMYNYERGRILYNEGRYDKSIGFIEKSYQYNPNHVDIKNLFVGNLLWIFTNVRDKKQALIDLEQYSEKYPELMNDSRFINIRFGFILNLCLMEFMVNNYDKGFEYIKDFEEIANSENINLTMRPVPGLIVTAYSEAGSYYFRKGNVTMTKRYLEKGLEYVPGDRELMSKLRAVNN